MNIFKIKLNQILFSIIFLSLPLQMVSQNEGEAVCGTETSQESINYFNSIKSQIKKYEQEYFSLASNFNKSNGTIKNAIPIKAHVIRSSNGTGGIEVSKLNSLIDEINAIYAGAYMEFFICDGINYIDNDGFYYFNKRDEEALIDVNNSNGLLNIYFTNSIENSSNESICGYSNNARNSDLILIQNDCATNGSSLAHEIGHFFSLMHTHGPDNDKLTTELVSGENCDTDGDGICDTPADPMLDNNNTDNFCDYIGNKKDANGNLFNPDTNNMMSYSRKGCRSNFTPQQLARMFAFYKSTKNYFSCSSFNADFIVDTAQTCDDNLTVNFSSPCSGVTSWKWDVDGDNIIDYTTQNPTHTFEKGNYDVTLTVSNKSKTISKTLFKHIKVGTIKSDAFVEDFDAFETANDSGWTANDQSRNGYNWFINSGETASDETGPLNDNTNTDLIGNYIYAEASNVNPGDVAEFISPCINITKENSELEFAYHMFGKNTGELHVDIITENGLINDVIPALYGSQQKNQDDAFITKSVDLSEYTHQTIKIRFRAIRGNGWEGDIAIDDIIIKTIHTPISDDTFKVYPNPVTNDLLYVKSNDSKLVSTYTISNLVGQNFISGTVSNRPINVSNLPSGTYLLILNDGVSRVVKKIIK